MSKHVWLAIRDLADPGGDLYLMQSLGVGALRVVDPAALASGVELQWIGAKVDGWPGLALVTGPEKRLVVRLVPNRSTWHTLAGAVISHPDGVDLPPLPDPLPTYWKIAS